MRFWFAVGIIITILFVLRTCMQMPSKNINNTTTEINDTVDVNQIIDINESENLMSEENEIIPEELPEENESIELEINKTEEEKCEESGGEWIALCSSAGCGDYFCECNNLKPDEQPETGIRSISYHKPKVNGLCIDCQQDSDCTEVPPVKTGCGNGAKGCYEYTKACEESFCVSKVIEHLDEKCVNQECVYLE